MELATHLSIPDNNLNKLEDLIKKQNINLLNSISEKYGLDPNELIYKFIECDYDVNKCLARTWNKGLGAQCSRKKKEGDLCLHHFKLSMRDKGLPHGRVDKSWIPGN